MNLSDVYAELDNFENYLKNNKYSPRFSYTPYKEPDLIKGLKGMVRWPLDPHGQLDEIELFEVTKTLLLIDWVKRLRDIDGVVCRKFNAKQLLEKEFGVDKTAALVKVFQTEEFSKAVFYSITGVSEITNQSNSTHMSPRISICA